MKVFVICAYEERKAKYLNDNRYTIWDAYHWNDIKDETVDLYNFRHNCRDILKKKITACSESHLACLKHIYDNKIDNCIIIEDDALIDFYRLDELKDIKDFCYIGGMMFPPLLKDKKDFVKPTFEKGLHEIDPETFVIHNAHGLYIPTHDIVPAMMRQTYPKRKAIDVEYKHQQKRKELKYFIYPAISTLHLEDSKKGFTWSNYKLADNLLKY